MEGKNLEALIVLSAALSIAVVVLIITLVSMTAEIKNITKQIDFIAENDTNMEISLNIQSPALVKLSKRINKLIVAHKAYRSEAVRANKSFRESITSISHDLRTPLTAASGYIQMLERDGITPEKRSEYVTVITQRIVSVQKMLEQLFEFARIEADEMTYESEVFNINNVMRDTVSELYDRFISKGITPEIDIPEQPYMIKAGKDMFARVLFNIINNAIIHGEESFCVRSRQDGKRYVMTFENHTDTVSDTDIDHIFDRFYTTDKSRTKKSTGLGLSIAYRLVTNMGGRIYASINDGLFCITVEFEAAKQQVSLPKK